MTPPLAGSELSGQKTADNDGLSIKPGFKYDFTAKDFGEEGNTVLELAYALTVHKAQGSEFGIVILV